jgi:hypothetical protein
MRFRATGCAAALGAGFVTATEVADWLAARAYALPPRPRGRGASRRAGPSPRAPTCPRAVERRDLVGAPAKARVAAAAQDAIDRISARKKTA